MLRAARVAVISIHALREEGDAVGAKLTDRQKKFLSTPSARRATAAAPMGCLCAKISIHALREEGDVRRTFPCTVTTRFLSTPSARRATDQQCRSKSGQPISIHALREEGDVQDFITARRSEDFYPRPPRGGRLKRLDGDTEKEKFLSTPSARRATLRSAHRSEKLFYFYPRPPRGGRLIDRSKCKTAAQISIHALREEGDVVGG